jgi:hypothetical protein
MPRYIGAACTTPISRAAALANTPLLSAYLHRPQLRELAGCSEKDAKLTQKLGQLQPFVAVFPQECMGQLAYFGPT